MNITYFLELKLQLEKSNLDLILAQDKVKKLEEQLAGKLHVIEQYKRQANKLNDVNMQLIRPHVGFV